MFLVDNSKWTTNRNNGKSSLTYNQTMISEPTNLPLSHAATWIPCMFYKTIFLAESVAYNLFFMNIEGYIRFTRMILMVITTKRAVEIVLSMFVEVVGTVQLQ